MSAGIIPGIHHITVVAGDPQRNLDFYGGALGLRLVKTTVNFDAPDVYHLYYGDEVGHPGTILTFFPFPDAPKGRRGSGTVDAVAFSVPSASLDYWRGRLAEYGVAVGAPETRFGEQVLLFADPDGLRLELIAHDEDGRRGWAGGPVPAECMVRGFHGATLLVGDAGPTARLLTGTMGFRSIGEEGGRVRYATGDGGPGAEVDLVAVPGTPRGAVAAGIAHHIAWRVADDASERRWRDELGAQGLDVTSVRDRAYFRSIYFHEPGGILFEIATDPPGFTVDEDVAALGSGLKLPPWLESRREELEGALPPLHRPTPAAPVSQGAS